jgi:hypothetical protein
MECHEGRCNSKLLKSWVMKFKKESAESGGATCPYCGWDCAREMSELEREGGTLLQDLECRECGGVWTRRLSCTEVFVFESVY